MKRPYLVELREWDYDDALAQWEARSEHYIVWADDGEELEDKCRRLLDAYLGGGVGDVEFEVVAEIGSGGEL